MHTKYVKALLYYKEHPKKLLYFIVSDLAFLGSIWIWYVLFRPSFDLVVYYQNPQSIAWKFQALGIAAIYALGIILLFGFFSALSIHIAAGEYSKGITFRRIRSMWFLQTTFAAILSALVAFLYVPFSAVFPTWGDKIILGILAFVGAYIGIACFIAGGVLAMTREIRIFKLPFQTFRVLGKHHKEGIVIFFAAFGIIALAELLVVLLFNLFQTKIFDTLHIILISGLIIIVRGYVKRVAVEILSETNL